MTVSSRPHGAPVAGGATAPETEWNAFGGFPAPRVAVLIPCYNEEVTIGEVVRGFRAALPDAAIWVFDNNSSDRTVEEARAAGARVAFERRQGKGYVVQSMFRKIDADIYVMVDGDGTYPAAVAERLIEPVRRGEADMVVGSRLHQGASSEFRLLNRFGNYLFLLVCNAIFGVRLTDLLSGYRAFSRRLVRGVPLFGGGFETEAEMTIKALQRGFAIVEVPVDLTRRPAGSESKIRIVQDSFVILSSILTLFRDYRPLTFFGGFGFLLVLLGLVPGIAAISDFLRTGLVNRFPSAILAVGLVLTGILTMMVGLILHTIARHFQELDMQLQTFAEDLRQRGHKREAP